jgi:hypothetical protein
LLAHKLFGFASMSRAGIVGYGDDSAAVAANLDDASATATH